MKIERVWQISERGRKQANFSAGILKFLGGSGLGGFVQQGVVYTTADYETMDVVQDVGVRIVLS